MNRRSLLAGILAAGTAPAICKASWLMRSSGLLVPHWDDPEYWAIIGADIYPREEVENWVLVDPQYWIYQAEGTFEHSAAIHIDGQPFIITQLKTPA